LFTVVFSKLAKLPSDAGAPYAIMILLVGGVWYFRKTEKAFADVI